MKSDRGLEWQVTAENFGALLSILRIEEKGEDSQHTTWGDRGQITLDSEAAWQLYEIVTGFLPRCWNARTYYGYYPAPDDCELPGSLCGTCTSEGRRTPNF